MRHYLNLDSTVLRSFFTLCFKGPIRFNLFPAQLLCSGRKRIEGASQVQPSRKDDSTLWTADREKARRLKPFLS